MENIRLSYSALTRKLYIVKFNKKGGISEKRELSEEENKLLRDIVCLEIKDGSLVVF